MSKIEFPKPLRELLEESDLQAPIRGLADRVGEILQDNKLPFFPDYTDHGIDHINRVMKSEVDLVPKQVWGKCSKDTDPRLLCGADAAVIIGATLLHDIAMHLRPDGFRELISANSRFLPLPWFRESHEGNSADLPWQELWENYIREARRFSDRQLTNIIGEESARVWKFYDLPVDPGQWERNHCLIIGEFIRRHHTRLAHEIAIYGFPGLPVGSGEGQFPAMGKEEGHVLMRLADLIGLTARSHGTSLRVCKSYIEASAFYFGTPRPMGTAVLYPMALLRVADYLQIDQQRAPAILLQLRNPQSPISVQEWKKHRAVQQIGPANDHRGKMVTVSTELSLSLYLQLRDLLSGLQDEMDHSTAVLDEAYGTLKDLGLDQLNLATRRVYSNMQSPAFRDSLPYVPNQTGFTADPNLLTLLVEPLYGKVPSVGVRELIQNAVDAVSELQVWCKVHKVRAKALDLPEQDGDVLVDFIKRENGTWFLRVRDRGIGMTSDTIQNYFLRAGASFRRSAEWGSEFLDEKGQAKVIRAGRFGIGAFALFLLGHSFKLWTRHAGSNNSMGYMLEATASSELIEIKRVSGLSVGTTIEAEVSSESVESLELEKEKYSDYEGPSRKIDWFCWDWPKVIKRVFRGPRPEVLTQQYTSPVRRTKLPPEWAFIKPEGFEAVFWTFDEQVDLSCNGMRVGNPEWGSISDEGFSWSEDIQLECPCIAVLDGAANLPLTTQRFALSQKTVPFINDLVRDVQLSFIAHALICGPSSQAEALLNAPGFPLRPRLLTSLDAEENKENPFWNASLRWCATSTDMVPIDPWLYSLLNSASCMVYGALSSNEADLFLIQSFASSLLDGDGAINHAIVSWFTHINTFGLMDQRSQPERCKRKMYELLTEIARKGVGALGQVKASHIIQCSSKSLSSISDEFSRGSSSGWREVLRNNSERRWFEAHSGSLNQALPLKNWFERMEHSLDLIQDERTRYFHTRFADGNANANVNALFAAEIQTEGMLSPDSEIAKIWNECLGAKAIPFDPDARDALIKHGEKHTELNRHITAWREMKRTGSKWVKGG